MAKGQKGGGREEEVLKREWNLQNWQPAPKQLSLLVRSGAWKRRACNRMRIYHQGWEIAISSLIASTYTQDGAKGLRAQNKAKGMQQNKPGYHIGHKHAGKQRILLLSNFQSNTDVLHLFLLRIHLQKNKKLSITKYFRSIRKSTGKTLLTEVLLCSPKVHLLPCFIQY